MEGAVWIALVDGWWAWMGRASMAAALLVVAAEVVQRSVLARSPEPRAWLWRIVYAKLALLLLLPGPLSLGVFILPELELDRAASVASPPVPAFLAPPAADPAGFRQARFADAPGSPPRAPASASPVRTALGALWLAGIAFATVRLLNSHRALCRCLREANDVEAASLRSWLPSVVDGAAGRVSVRWSRDPAVTGPMVVGFRKPVILLPDRQRLGLSDAELRLVLAHELAHVRRRDLAWMTLRRWVNVVLFFHPLVRRGERQAALADEIACDAIAVASTGARGGDYGRLLLRVSEAAAWGREFEPLPGVAGLGPAGHRLATRLRALAIRCRRVGRREAIVWILLAIGVLAGGAVTFHARRSIRQFDPTYRVTGFLVSHGAGHGVSVTRERCQWLGFRLSQATQRGFGDSAGGGPAAPSAFSWPRRVAGWLGATGLKPRFETESYGVQVYDGEPGCAILVRFAAGSGVPPTAAIAGELVDDAGESIPLPVRALGGGGGEFVRAWSLSPAPVTPARFQLRLTLPESGRELARLRLGTIGGRREGS